MDLLTLALAGSMSGGGSSGSGSGGSSGGVNYKYFSVIYESSTNDYVFYWVDGQLSDGDIPVFLHYDGTMHFPISMNKGNTSISATYLIENGDDSIVFLGFIFEVLEDEIEIFFGGGTEYDLTENKADYNPFDIGNTPK